jgi:alpha/beta superfamily hydrolase
MATFCDASIRTIIGWIVCCAAAPFAAYAISIYLRQWRLIFPATKKDLATPADAGITFEEHLFPWRKGKALRLWWIPGKSGCALLFGSRRGNISSELSSIAFLHRCGLGVVAIDYPGYGKSAGAPSERGCYEAARCARTFALDKGTAPSELIYFGRSLGGAVASFLAQETPCKGLILHSSITSVPDIGARLYPWLPVRIFCHTRMNAIRYLSHCSAPTLLLHSPQDSFAPYAFALRLYQVAPLPRKFVNLQGDHLSLGWDLRSEVQESVMQLITGEYDSWEQTPGGRWKAGPL